MYTISFYDFPFVSFSPLYDVGPEKLVLYSLTIRKRFSCELWIVFTNLGGRWDGKAAIKIG